MRYTKAVDNLSCLCENVVMPTHEETLQRMARDLQYERAQVVEAHTEMTKHEESYRKFIDLEKAAKAREEHIRRLFLVIGTERFMQMSHAELSDAAERVVTGGPSLALWEAMKEYLLVVKEATVSETQAFFEFAQINSSRQAIESALRQHPETFRSKKKGRERYISLKES